MSFIENVKFSASDSPTIDAFARIRVSEPYTVFDSKQTVDDQPLFWANAITGSGSAAHSAVYARTRLSVITLGDKVIRQTKQYFNYQPGKSQLIFITGLYKQETNIEKEIGLDDGINGISLRIDGTAATNVSFLIRKNSVVSEEVDKTNWNVDKFDGTGPSGITLDLNQTQILYIDFEWLGVGRVRCGFVVDGVPYVAHQFVHANHTSNDSVYMSNPNLPVRYYIQSNGVGATGSLDHICASIMSEGGQENTGTLRAIDNGSTGVAVNTGVTRPLLALRHKSTARTSTIIAEKLSVLCTTANTNFLWELLLNPTSSTGTDFTTGYTALTSSTTEFKTAFTGTITDRGIKIASGYGSNEAALSSSDINSFLRIGYDISTGTEDVLVLIVTAISANGTFHGSLTFREIV